MARPATSDDDRPLASTRRRAAGLFGHLRAPNVLADPQDIAGTFPLHEEVRLPDVTVEQLRPLITAALVGQGFEHPVWIDPSPDRPREVRPGRLAYCAAEGALHLDARNARIADGLVLASLVSIGLGLSLGGIVPGLEAHRAIVLLLSILGPCLLALVGFALFPSQFRSDLVVVRLEASEGTVWPPPPVGLFGLKRVDWPPRPTVARVVIESGTVLTENLAARVASPTRRFVGLPHRHDQAVALRAIAGVVRRAYGAAR